MTRSLVVTKQSTRPLLGVDCVQLPPLDDGGGRDGLLQGAGGLQGLPAEEGLQHCGQQEGGGVELLPDWTKPNYYVGFSYS